MNFSKRKFIKNKSIFNKLPRDTKECQLRIVTQCSQFLFFFSNIQHACEKLPRDRYTWRRHIIKLYAQKRRSSLLTQRIKTSNRVFCLNYHSVMISPFYCVCAREVHSILMLCVCAVWVLQVVVCLMFIRDISTRALRLQFLAIEYTVLAISIPSR